MMRSRALTVLIVFMLVSCKNDKAEETESAKNPSIEITQIVGIGKIEPENEIIQLSSEVGGVVQKIYKKENDSVHMDDIIAELKHTVDDAKINQLRLAAAIQAAQIKVDKEAVNELQVRYANATVELSRLQILLAKGAETRQVVDDATTEMKSINTNIVKLLATVEVSRIKWAETKSQVAIAEAELQQKFIKAPVNGLLLELNIQPGNYIDSQQIFAQLKPEGKVIAVSEIDELFADQIKIGQTALIRNFGATDTLTTGKVYFASSFLKKKSLFTDQAGEKVDRRVREIKILLDQPANILLNSRIECVVFISKNDN